MLFSHKSIGAICVFLSATLFAWAGVLIKFNSWSSMTINGTRCFFAFMMIAGYMKVKGHKFIFNRAVLGCGMANFLMGLLFVYANKMTTAANAIVLQFTMPLFIILLLWIFWKEKPHRAELIACAASFVGIICFFFDRLSFTGMMGNVLAILSGLFYAVVFLTKKVPGADFESATLVSFLISFVLALPSILQEVPTAPDPGRNLLDVMALGLIQQGISYILLNIGLNRISSFSASLLSMWEPILNPLLVAVIFGEVMGPMALIGSVIVLGSAIFYNLRAAS